ncbi:hypothetical protein FQN53_005340 [Emmonsiellopsis sp. PD_33]|nr:hypothetical protein FQN53_005340 [Emmonsiellopsis sp. PD_33]
MARKLPEAYSAPDVTSINLAHLLARLESNLLSPTADLKPLYRSQYHRARVGANVEYARTLLLKLELSLPNIKIQSRKHALQTDLAQKRQQIKALAERLDEIGAAAEAGSDTQDFSSDNEEEDILPTPSDSTPGTTSPARTTTLAENLPEGEKEAEETPETTTREQQEQTPDQTPDERCPSPSQVPEQSNTLRNRHPPKSPSADQSTSTTAATATGTSASLFPSHPSQPTPPTATTSTSSPEASAALTHDSHEQETLTESLLTLATQLKASSQAFHTSIESEQSILSRAAEGLDRNTTGMEAAGKRMGMLRRMSEGRGWWGRMMMYAWIFGLWIVAVLIVFLGPKLRF